MLLACWQLHHFFCSRHAGEFKGLTVRFPGFWFKREPAPLMGLDIRSSSVKLVELAHMRSGPLRVLHVGIEQLQPGWVADDQINDFEQVAQGLRRLVRRCGTKTRLAAMALPGAAVITRNIKLPAGLSDAELAVQVESEANQYIPFPMDEANLDFCSIGPTDPAAQDIDVMIAASRKERVQDMLGLAEAAGLKLAILDIRSYASRRAAARILGQLPGTEEASPIVALFEMGGQSTSLQVMQGEILLYEREQAFGGAKLTRLLAEHYGWTTEVAEARKRSGELPPADAQQILRAFAQDAAQEIGRAMQFFFSSTPHTQVQHILLAGGSAAVPGLAEAVAAHNGVACSLADPFRGMLSDPGLAGEAPSYLVACGLALRRFAT
jgi:type IV pilus assembly protein PilM